MLSFINYSRASECRGLNSFKGFTARVFSHVLILQSHDNLQALTARWTSQHPLLPLHSCRATYRELTAAPPRDKRLLHLTIKLGEKKETSTSPAGGRKSTANAVLSG